VFKIFSGSMPHLYFFKAAPDFQTLTSFQKGVIASAFIFSPHAAHQSPRQAQKHPY